MPVIAAYLYPPVLEAPPTPGQLSSGLSGFGPVDNSPPNGVYAGYSNLYSAVVSQLPISENATVIAGAKAPSFLDDYYYRIHVVPLAIDFGNLVSRVDRQIGLWNSFLEDRTLTAIQKEQTDGLQLAVGPEPPFTFQGLQEQAYTLRAFLDGPPIIDAAFTFVFDNGETPKLTIVGRRILVFPFAPNWDTGVSETLEWKTDVLRSYKGTEQRRALRVVPRRGFEYQFLLKNTDTGLLETLLWGWQIRNFAVPVWTDRSLLTSAAAAGDLVLDADTTTRSFVPGDLAVLLSGSTAFEVIVIESVTDSQVIAQFPLQQNWPVTAELYPVVIGHLPMTVPLQRYTDSVVTGRASFVTNPVTTPPYLPEAAPSETYEGLEVIRQQPNWRTPINNDFTHAFNTVDVGVGPVSWYSTEENARITRPYAYLLKNRQEILEFRQLLQRLKGQAKTVWIPSWHNDLKVVGTTPDNQATLRIAGTEFGNYVGVNTSRDRIMVVLYSGEIYYRKIIDVLLDVSSTTLVLDAIFGRVITPEDVKIVHLLLRCRMAADKVEIPWRTNSVAEPVLTFTTVPL